MPQADKERLWEKALAEIELLISRANFTTWFQNTNILEEKDDMVFLGVPNAFAKEWIKNKYHKFIIKTLRSLRPSIRTVEYIICNHPIVAYEKIPKKHKMTNEPTEATPQLDFNEFYETEDSLNSRYSFDNFIVGSFNELPHAAAVAVSKNLGSLYNPLFIYGGVGMGKTHLLQAIGNRVKGEKPDMKAKYTTSEKFANELIKSIRNNKTYEFKEKYKRYDLLIIDDVQFLAGKEKTQEEFFHIFNTLYENNKQVIFSSDRPPKSIPDLEERLKSRFEGGMMADITEPEYESRVAILKSKSQTKNLDLSEEAIEYIASVIKNNIREMEGALNLLSAQTKLLGKNLNTQEIKDILNKNISHAKKKVTFSKIVKIVAVFHEIEERCLFEKSRRREFVLPRQIAMYLLREDFNGSYPYIGRKFGGRDHTTVIHAYEKISRCLKSDQQLKDNVQKIREQLYE